MKTFKIIFLSTFVNLLVILVLVLTSAFYANKNPGAVFNFINPNNLSSSAGDDQTLPDQEAGGQISRGSQVEQAVAQVNAAVVAIVATKDVPILEQYFEDDPLGGFFSIPRYRENGSEKREIGSGSGFFVSADGLLLTNKHVVADIEAQYTVLTNDNEKLEAQVLARDHYLDIAILKVDKNPVPYVALGDSDQLKLGQSVIAIGNALGEFRNSISVGVISGLSRSIVANDSSGGSETLEQVIQTDAAINPGNSGGPLLDLQGKAIGVNVAVAQGSENIGFALPINMVKSVVDSVAKYGEIIRPYLGIRYLQIDKSVQQKNNLPFDYGVLITRGESRDELAVIPASPAAKAGLVENDIILSIDREKLDGQKSLSWLIRQKQVGQEVILQVWSNGNEKELKVKLGKAPVVN